MTPLYLSFDSEAQADALLYSGEERVPNYRNIDVIGTLYDLAEDPEAEPVALPGWHVNVLLVDDEDGSALEAYETTPTTPRRVFATTPAVTVLPLSLTRAQARAALILAGLIDLVQPAINTIADPVQRALVQNDWDHRLHFERNNPTLIALATGLGLTESQVDDLFTAGAQL